MVEIRLVLVRREEARDILSSSGPLRNLDDIILDIAEINEKGSEGVNLSDAKKLEVLGLELIKHARVTAEASY
jgi:hypothetical protein